MHKAIVIFNLSLICLFCNCKNDKVVKTDGNVRYTKVHDAQVDLKVELFDSLGNRLERYYLKDSLRHGVQTKYYSNGQPQSEGYWIRGYKNGWFKFFNEQGIVNTFRQYIRISDSEHGQHDYLNQVVHVNNNGDTTREGSFYLKLIAADTIKKGENFWMTVKLAAPMFKESLLILCDYNKEFALMPNAICDTFGMLNFANALSPLADRPGRNVIRGQVVNFENYIDSNKIKKQRIATIFFEKVFWVVE